MYHAFFHVVKYFSTNILVAVSFPIMPLSHNLFNHPFILVETGCFQSFAMINNVRAHIFTHKSFCTCAHAYFFSICFSKWNAKFKRYPPWRSLRWLATLNHLHARKWRTVRLCQYWEVPLNMPCVIPFLGAFLQEEAALGCMYVFTYCTMLLEATVYSDPH